MKTPVLLVLPLLLLGCATSSEPEVKVCAPSGAQVDFAPLCTGNKVHVLLSEDFDDAQRKDLTTAFQDWERATRKVVVFELEYVPNERMQHDIVKDNSTFYFFHEAPKNKDDAGWTEWSPSSLRAVIEVGDITNPMQPFLGAVKHEIGHALHLQHYMGPEPAVMGPESTMQFIEKVDIQAFCQVWKIEDCSPPVGPSSQASTTNEKQPQ